MIYTEKPIDFKPKLEVVGCFVEYQDTFLMLHRQSHKPEPDVWGIPSGKVDPDDTSLLIAMQRELQEETGIIVSEDKLSLFKTVYVRYETHDIIYHMFELSCNAKPDVVLSPDEHVDYQWVRAKESYNMNLMIDMVPCIQLKYGT